MHSKLLSSGTSSVYTANTQQTAYLDGQSQDRSDVSAHRALDAPLPAPFDEEAALSYLNYNTPSWDNPVSKAFTKLVPKYTDTLDCLDLCKSIQRFTSSGFSHINVSGSVQWRLALRHLPTKYYDIVLNTVISPGFQGLTWKSFVLTVNRHVSAQSEVQRAQKSVRNFSAMRNESLRNFLMRFMSRVTVAVSDKDVLVPPMPYQDVLRFLSFAIDRSRQHLSPWVANWWRLNAAEKIAHIRSSATETSQAAELSKQTVHALIQQMLAFADSSFGGFEPTNARGARDTPDSGLIPSNTTLNN
jgi:hypothetical protein